MTFEELKKYDISMIPIVHKSDCDSRFIEMAWQDRTPFEALQREFCLNENQVIKKMRKLLTPASFKRWRKRVSGRNTKHHAKISLKITRFQGPW